MQVGTTKDQGLYNKPWAAVHPGGISRRDPIIYNIKNNRSTHGEGYTDRSKHDMDTF